MLTSFARSRCPSKIGRLSRVSPRAPRARASIRPTPAPARAPCALRAPQRPPTRFRSCGAREHDHNIWAGGQFQNALPPIPSTAAGDGRSVCGGSAGRPPFPRFRLQRPNWGCPTLAFWARVGGKQPPLEPARCGRCCLPHPSQTARRVGHPQSGDASEIKTYKDWATGPQLLILSRATLVPKLTLVCSFAICCARCLGADRSARPITFGGTSECTDLFQNHVRPVLRRIK
jgi:hypothetical protein